MPFPETGLLEHQAITQPLVLLKPPPEVLLGVSSRFEIPIAEG
jgi:hypothetical protein